MLTFKPRGHYKISKGRKKLARSWVPINDLKSFSFLWGIFFLHMSEAEVHDNKNMFMETKQGAAVREMHNES